jgi:hypothetical protein
MTTDAQMRADEWYRRETTPIQLTRLAARLAEHYRVPLDNFGIRGNLVHFQGYHRSREFVLHSSHCTDRTYSVSRTDGDHNGGDARSVSAIDIQVPRAELLLMCKRLDKAIRAGKLEKVTEWYGNTNGDNRVDGYDNISNRVATSDDSHLWHLHISFDRGKASDDHGDLFTILTGGVVMEGFSDLTRDQYVASISERVLGVLSGENPIKYKVPGSERDYSEPNNLQAQLDRIEGAWVDDDNVDAFAIAVAAKLTEDGDFVSAIASKIAQEVAAIIQWESIADAVVTRLKERL